ncbi:fructosamine kinase family protein [Amphritea sp.]|uniref:fructosamine kinase family protein n=1 Tax=Amphritea sp. TaxID=1872502 RepID=UPI003D0ECFD0
MPDLLPQPIVKWIEQHSLQLIRVSPLSGGCVAQISKLTLQSPQGNRVEWVLKQMPDATAEPAAAEVRGLKTLGYQTVESHTLRVPEVLLQAGNSLLMEYLSPASPADDFDQQLGMGLALLHRCRDQAERGFGFECDTFCGGTRQVNHWQADGYRFYAQQRYQSLGERCLALKLISHTLFDQLLQWCDRLPERVPAQPAVLLHGDLWSGNVICGPHGEPVLIDPAVYYGWAEAELAMTLMFGGFSQRFYQIYEAHSDILPDWRVRADLYNLYHYLNHLLLFGGAYLRDVERIVKYYNG